MSPTELAGELLWKALVSGPASAGSAPPRSKMAELEESPVGGDRLTDALARAARPPSEAGKQPQGPLNVSNQTSA